MTFMEWHLAMYGVYPGTGIKVNGFEARKEAWNACAEEAAKINERLAEYADQGAGEYPWGQRSMQAARMIRSLKEE